MQLSPSPLTDLPAFQGALRSWFQEHARDLPWRHTQDPYAIVVSELMLQQTQVKTVLPYYRRWLEAFPSFAALAAAPEERVLGLWQGLGYYSRARSLHRLAKAVVAEHPQGFPRELAQIRNLPGIGPYTAGAIAAFAFDVPVPAVDGNIARVLARLFDISDPVDSAAGLERIWAAAESILPSGPGGGREQVGAIMELGAMICIPRKPLCLLCPVSGFCAARALAKIEELPIKKARPKSEARVQDAAWAMNSAGELLLQRSAGPLWRDMWHLPLLAAAPTAEPALTLEFGITRYRVQLRVHATGSVAAPECVGFRLQGAPAQALASAFAWYGAAALVELPIPAPHRRAILRLLQVA